MTSVEGTKHRAVIQFVFILEKHQLKHWNLCTSHLRSLWYVAFSFTCGKGLQTDSVNDNTRSGRLVTYMMSADILPEKLGIDSGRHHTLLEL